MRLIAQVTANNDATIDVALPQGFDWFRVVIDSLLPATDGAYPLLRVSTDNGSNYATANYVNAGFGAWTNHGHIPTPPTAGYILGWTDTGNATGEGTSCTVSLLGMAAGMNSRALAQALNTNAGAIFVACWSAGQYTASTDRVTHIRLLFSAGNISSGSISVYGV
jgi:hypothetical protein